MSNLPILNYHGIETRENEYPWLEEEKPYVLPFTKFEAQLNFLAENDFKSLSLNGLEDWLEKKVVHAKPIVLTFDDGHICHCDHVIDALIKRNIKAIFFIPTKIPPHHFLNIP